MKLNWIMGKPDSRRPLKDVRDLFKEEPPIEMPSGGMGRDVETAFSVESVLASRSRYKKPLDPNRP